MAAGSQKGERRGGRQKGVPNKATIERQREVADSGVTPLEFMLDVMRTASKPPPDADPKEWEAYANLRFEAAKAAAPYVHPKLAAIEHSGTITTRTVAEELAELNAITQADSRPTLAH